MRAENHHIVCSIAGSDPTGGAGLQGDLKTFAAHGLEGTAIVTAITVQGTSGVRSVTPVDPGVLRDQLDVVVAEVRPDAWKTGMLWSAALVRVVADAAAGSPQVSLVVDPVLSASAGGTLAGDTLLDALRTDLLPLAHVITPNVPEAAALLGVPELPMDGLEDAALALQAMGPAAVVLTGGHTDADPVADVVVTPGRHVEIVAVPRVARPPAHGTGCAFSAALTAGIAAGLDVPAAAAAAQRYVALAMQESRIDGRLRHGVPFASG